MICTDCKRDITESNPVVAMCFIKGRANQNNTWGRDNPYVTMCRSCSGNIPWASKQPESFQIFLKKE